MQINDSNTAIYLCMVRAHAASKFCVSNARSYEWEFADSLKLHNSIFGSSPMVFMLQTDMRDFGS